MNFFKKAFSLAVTLSMTLSLSGIVSTPILAEEENVVDGITENENVDQSENVNEDQNDETQEDPIEDSSENTAEGTNTSQDEQVDEDVTTRNVDVKEEYIITPEDDVNSILQDAEENGEAALIQAGNYDFGFTVKNITLYVEGVVQVQGGITLENAVLQGASGNASTDQVLVNETNTHTTVKSATLESVTLQITGSNLNYLLIWSSGNFIVNNSILSASGNTNGSGMFVSSRTAGSKFQSNNSTVAFNENIQGTGGSGIWANVDGNANAVFEFVGGSLSLNNNELNGFMGSPAPLFGGTVPTPTFVFENCNVQVNGNGSPEDSGQGDGFSYGYITLKNTNGGNYTFEVSGNSNNGLDGGRGNNAALNADGYTILANNNGNIGLNVSKLNAGTSQTTITNSKVQANNNGKQGILFKQSLNVTGSTIAANANGSQGIRFYSSSGVGTIDNTSTITAQDNKDSGLYIYSDSFSTSGKLDLQRNQNSGLYVSRGNVVVDGSDIVIKDNTTKNNGGGIYNNGTLTLSASTDPTPMIYNNTADKVGDDVYNSSRAGNLTLSAPAAGQILTADRNDTNEDQAITNWFYDGANPNYEGKLGDAGKTARWDMDSYAKLFTYNDNTKIITGEIGLKAAYAPVTTFTPIDLTMYVGGDGYENVDGTTGSNNGFPEPGYFVILPDEINKVIQTDGQPVDLSQETENFVFGYTYNHNNGEEIRHWQMTKYTDAEGSDSTMDNRYVYSLSLTDGTRKPTLRVIDEAGNVQTNANFDLTNAVNKKYTTMVGTVEGDSFVNDGQESAVSTKLTANVQTDTIDVDFDRTIIGTGKLYVRGVTNVTDKNLVTPIQKEGTDPEAGVPMATVPEGTTFYINGEEGLEVQLDSEPSLLYDDILPEGTDANNDRREGWLKDKAEKLCDQYGLLEQAGITNPQYSFKYMDIVDKKNGNVVLEADKNVTVYMPYPKGVDKDTSIIVLHYKDLNRNMTYDDVQSAVMNCEMEKMTITQLDNHIKFETTSFSPFVVIWGTDEAGEIVKNEDRADTGLFQNMPLYIALMTACASLVAIVAIKRRIDAK